MYEKFEGFRNARSLANANAFYDIVKDQRKVDIKKKNRRSSIVKYRRFFYKFMQEVCKEPLTTIGAYLNQDHATVLHGIRRVEDIFLRKEGEKREYDLLKSTALGVEIPVYTPDEKDLHIQVLTEILQNNHKLLCSYQNKISELELSLSKLQYKLAQRLSKNSELKKEINIMRAEAKAIYQEYKKQKGIII